MSKNALDTGLHSIQADINPELTDEQKRIMFKEATERPFSSSLNNEKRKGFFHCANCGAKLFHLRQSLIVVQAGLLFQNLYPEHLKLK